MAYFDTGYVNVAFYGVSYGIRVDGHADRNDGSTAVRFHGTMYDRQNTGTWNTDPHYSSIGELIGEGQIKPGGSGGTGRVYTRGFNTTLGIGIGATSKGFNANFRGGGASHNIGFTAHFNDGYSSPTGLGVSSPQVTENSISAVVSLSGWGHNSGGAKYRELTVSRVNNNTSNRRFQSTGNTGALSSRINVTNSSAQTGSLNISPNTRYYLAGYASNGNRSTGVQFRTEVVTLSRGTHSIARVRPSKIDMNVTAVGGVYTPTIRFRYRKKGSSSWITSPESYVGTSGSILLQNLSASTLYEMQQVVITSAGTWYGATFEVKTKPASIIIFPDGSKKNVAFRLIYPNGKKRDIERWKKIVP